MKTRDILLLAAIVLLSSYAGSFLGKTTSAEAAPAKQEKKNAATIGGAKKPTQRTVWEYKVLYFEGIPLRNGLCANTTLNPAMRKVLEEADNVGGDKKRLKKAIEVYEVMKKGPVETSTLDIEGKDGWEYVDHQVSLLMITEGVGVQSCTLEVVFKRPSN